MQLAARLAFPFLLALFLSLALTPIVRRLALRLGAVARPVPGRWHKRDTPVLGGIAIFLASLAAVAASLSVDRLLPLPSPGRQALGWLLGALIVFAAGLLDDFRPLRPATKLFAQIAAACVALLTGTSFGGLPSQVLAVVLTIVWVAGITNSFNLIDNMDGLAAGTAAIALGFLSIYSLGDPLIAPIALALMGAALGFLRYNFHPARIFMGDCGSMFLGYSISLLAVAGTARPLPNVVATLIVPLFVLGVPIFDTAFVSLSRIFRGQPVTQGGRDHTSHRLVVLGLPEPRVVALVYGASLLFGAIALLYARLDLTLVGVFAVLTLVVAVVFALFLEEVPVEAPPAEEEPPAREVVPGRTVLRSQLFYKRQFVELFLDFLLVCAAYYLAFLLRFEGDLTPPRLRLLLDSLPILIVVKLSAFHFYGLYRGYWRYVVIYDYFEVVKAVSLGSLLGVLAVLFFYRFAGFSRSLFVIDWLLLLVLATGVRLIIPGILATLALYGEREGKRALVVGAGDAGELLLRELRRNRRLGYRPVGILDDDPAKRGRAIHGLRVLGGGEDLPRVVREQGVEEVLIAIPSADGGQLERICEACRRARIPYRRMGPLLGERVEP